MTDIAVVDYGMGNLRSVSKAIEHVAPGRTVIVTSDPGAVRAAARVVFPGQGAMPDCMRELDARRLREAVLEAARSKPFLGICIGLQMLFERSEEGDVARPGFAARARWCDFPMPTWWTLPASGSRCRTWAGTRCSRRSRTRCGRASRTAAGSTSSTATIRPRRSARSLPGIRLYPFPFACAVASRNLFAVQFHPEKSQACGLRLLANFVDWDGAIPARTQASALPRMGP